MGRTTGASSGRMADGKGSAVLTSHPRARLVLISPGCTANAVSAPHSVSLRGGRRETLVGRAVRAAWQDGTGAANTHPLAQFKRERPEYTDTTQATPHSAPLLWGEAGCKQSTARQGCTTHCLLHILSEVPCQRTPVEAALKLFGSKYRRQL